MPRAKSSRALYLSVLTRTQMWFWLPSQGAYYPLSGQFRTGILQYGLVWIHIYGLRVEQCRVKYYTLTAIFTMHTAFKKNLRVSGRREIFYITSGEKKMHKRSCWEFICTRTADLSCWQPTIVYHWAIDRLLVESKLVERSSKSAPDGWVPQI